MAYYLTIRKKDTYIPIDIECLTCFTKLSSNKETFSMLFIHTSKLFSKIDLSILSATSC